MLVVPKQKILYAWACASLNLTGFAHDLHEIQERCRLLVQIQTTSNTAAVVLALSSVVFYLIKVAYLLMGSDEESNTFPGHYCTVSMGL